MAAPGYLVFPGKAFHCDILLNIGVHFKAGRIQFLEFFRVIPPEQRKSYDAAVSYDLRIACRSRSARGLPVGAVASWKIDAAALLVGSLRPRGASACFLFCSEELTCQASKQERLIDFLRCGTRCCPIFLHKTALCA